MNHPILVILGRVLSRAGPKISIHVPVPLEVAVDCRRKCVASDVKLAIFIQEWSFNIFLDYIGAFLAVNLLIVDNWLDVIYVPAHLDSSSTVCVLARLYYPHAMAVSGEFYQFWLRLRVLVYLEKLLEFSVIFAIFYMEGKGYKVKWILAARFIVDLHIIPDSLFVAQMEIVLLMIRCDHIMASMVLLFRLFLVFVLAFLPASKNDICRGLVSARGDASISLLERRKSLLLGSLRRRYQILHWRIALFISWLRRHQTLWTLLPLYFFVFEFFYVFIGFNTVQNLVWLPLCPQELIVSPLVIVTHWPPEARFQCCTNQYGVVSFPNVVFVGCEGRIREFAVKIIGFVDLGKEFTIVLLF